MLLVLYSTSDKEAKEQSDLTYLRTNPEIVSLRIPATFFLNKDDERYIREEIQDQTQFLLLITSSSPFLKKSHPVLTQRCFKDKNHI